MSINEGRTMAGPGEATAMGLRNLIAEKPALRNQLEMRKADLQRDLGEVNALLDILEKNKDLEEALTLFAKCGLRY